jgi:two-component system, NtrC family, response regulator AtoC
VDSAIKIIISKQKFDIAVLDIEFAGSDKDGFDILKELKRFNHSVKVIMLSGHDGFDAALRSFRMGADHFISKKNFNLEYFNDILDLIQLDGAPLIIGKSIATLEMFNKMSLYSKYSHDVLILGPNGTGKELIAKSVYHLGRKKGRFLTKNCAGVPNELFEAEMFGYVDGAFTGALKGGRKSPFEEAENGVLFLDEVGDMPIYQQSKLLRVLQERKVIRLGENIERNVKDSRLIFATNKNLKEQIKKGEFREDFYFRITGAVLNSPALKERNDDIELLTAYFVSKFMRDNGISESIKIKITEASFGKLRLYQFPGNIRELEKMVYQAMLNFLSDQKNKELCFEMPEAEENEFKRPDEIEYYPVESIISLIERGAITTRGLSQDLRTQIINHLSGRGMNTKQIADKLGINDQSLRNMKADLKK